MVQKLQTLETMGAVFMRRTSSFNTLVQFGK